jgi:hypothetical protein
MSQLIEEHKPQAVVIDCSAIPDFEYIALKILTEAEQRLRNSGVSLSLAALNPEPLKLVRNSKLGKFWVASGCISTSKRRCEPFKPFPQTQSRDAQHERPLFAQMIEGAGNHQTRQTHEL